MAELSKTLTITLGCKWLISPPSVCVQAQLAQKPAHTTLQQLGSREASFGQRETVSWILKQLAILFFFLNQDLLRELWPCLHWKLHEGKACPVGEKILPPHATCEAALWTNISAEYEAELPPRYVCTLPYLIGRPSVSSCPVESNELILELVGKSRGAGSKWPTSTSSIATINWFLMSIWSV